MFEQRTTAIYESIDKARDSTADSNGVWKSGAASTPR
jgi:hypothetical protein